MNCNQKNACLPRQYGKNYNNSINNQSFYVHFFFIELLIISRFLCLVTLATAQQQQQLDSLSLLQQQQRFDSLFRPYSSLSKDLKQASMVGLSSTSSSDFLSISSTILLWQKMSLYDVENVHYRELYSTGQKKRTEKCSKKCPKVLLRFFPICPNHRWGVFSLHLVETDVLGKAHIAVEA